MVDNNPRSDTPSPQVTDNALAERKRPNPLLWLLLLLALLVLGWWFFQQRSPAPVVAPESPVVTDVPATPDAGAAATAETERKQAATRAKERAAAEKDKARPAAKPKPSSDRSAEPIARLQPEYPREALCARVEGSVVLSVDVDAAGNPANVGFVQRSTSRELDRAAVDAVRKWKFKPAISKGKPVASTVQVPIDFKLDQ